MPATYFWTSTTSADPTVGANWTKTDGTTGTAPANGDTAYVQSIPGVLLSNISFADMSAVTLAALYLYPPAGMTIGTFDTTSANFFGYWKIGATVCNIGTQDGTANSGSQRIKINFGSAATTVTVQQTNGATADPGYAPVRLCGTSSSNVLNSLSGTVGVATNLPGETSDFSGGVNVAGGAVTLGAGVTWATANVAAGSLIANSGGASLSVAQSAQATLNGAAIITTISVDGSLKHNARPSSGAGTTTLNITANGAADFSGNPSAVTVMTVNLSKGAKIIFNAANPGHLTIGTLNKILCGTLTAS